MNEEKPMTIGELKKKISNIPDDCFVGLLVYYNDGAASGFLQEIVNNVDMSNLVTMKGYYPDKDILEKHFFSSKMVEDNNK